MLAPAVRCEAVAHLCAAFKVSERRACSAIEAHRGNHPLPLAATADLRLRERVPTLDGHAIPAHRHSFFPTARPPCSHKG